MYFAEIRGSLLTYQSRIAMGARTVGPTHPDRWALNVMGQLLDVSLTKEIRNKRGLVYGLWAHNYVYSDIDIFVRLPQVTRRIEEDLFDMAYEIELKYNCLIDMIILADSMLRTYAEQIPIYQKIVKEGLLL